MLAFEIIYIIAAINNVLSALRKLIISLIHNDVVTCINIVLKVKNYMTISEKQMQVTQNKNVIH